MRRISVSMLACFSLLMLAAPLRVDALQVYLEPDSAREGDIVDLILQYESEIPSLYALDTEVLNRDFEVIDMQSRIQRLTGYQKQRLRMQWIVKIAPRRAGMLEIPGLQLGDMQSRPIWLDVRSRSEDDLREVDVRVELEATPLNPYPDQQVIVSMRLISNQPLGKGRFSEPTVDRSRVYRGGEERHWVEQRAGRNFDVLERKLSLFAESPGMQTIGPASFAGFLAEPSSRQILRRSGAIELQVRSPPTEAGDGPWLPAAAIELQLHWSGDAERITVGESLGLELSILARGLPAENLPTDLLSRSHPGYRIYADEAQLSNQFEGASIVGQLRQSFVFVASRPGSIALPDTIVTWWDTGANRWRETRLAGRQLQIEAHLDLADRTAAEELSRRGSSPTWIWICAVVLACGFLWYGLQTAGGRRWRNRLAALRDRRVLKNALRDACRRDDAAEARASLRAWAARRWPGEWFYGLSAIAGKFADPGFDRELVKLDAALYAARPPSWRGAGLWDRFLTCERGLSEAAAHRRPVLPRIYPDQSRLPSRAQPFTGAKRSP